MNEGIISKSLNFPDFCLDELTSLLGKDIAVKVKESLEKKTAELINAFDLMFTSRKIRIDKTSEKSQRRLIQLQCHNPAQISAELREVIEFSKGGEHYNYFADKLKENVEIRDLVNRYLLPSNLYGQIMQTSFRSLSELGEPLQDLSSAIKNQIDHLEKFQETRYLRTGATIAAAIAGGMVGNVGGHFMRRVGSKLAGHVVGNFLSGNGNLENTASATESAYCKLEKVWSDIKSPLQSEIRVAIYTTLGGLILRLTKDLQYLGKTFSKLDLDSGEIIISLNTENRNRFVTWANETKSGIEDLIKSRDFNAASLASYRAMTYCLENGSRMVELCQGRSFVLIFQEHFICASDIVAFELWETGQKEKALDWWNATVNSTPFFPDTPKSSLFLRALAISSGCLKDTNAELVNRSITLIKSIKALYVRRILVLVQPSCIDPEPIGEIYSHSVIYLLAVQEKENLLGQSENSNALLHAIKASNINFEFINQTSLAWLWQAIITVREFDPNWSNTLTRCLILKYARKVRKNVAVSILSVGSVVAIVAISYSIYFQRNPKLHTKVSLPVHLTTAKQTKALAPNPAIVTSGAPVEQIKSKMMEKYDAFHDTKSYAEWTQDDMITAVNILAHPDNDVDLKAISEAERSTLEQECATGSCFIIQQEFTAARKIREGKAKTAQEALGLAPIPVDLSGQQQQLSPNEPPPMHEAISASQVIETMLDAARTDWTVNVITAKEALSNLPKPQRGDRKLSRERNKAGLAALNLGNYKDAVELFSEGASADKSDTELINNFGYALMMDGQLDAAKSKLIDTLSLDITRSGAWANLGNVFAKSADPENAVAAFKLSYYFSHAPDKTIEFFKKRSESDTDANIRNASLKALALFPNIQPLIAQTTVQPHSEAKVIAPLP